MHDLIPHTSVELRERGGAAIAGLSDLISRAVSVSDDELVGQLDSVLRHVEAIIGEAEAGRSI